MAIYGLGSMYGSTEEKLPEFIKRKRAFVGYKPGEAPAIHQMMMSIKVGDIVFVKSFNGPHGLFIKAVGLVYDNKVTEDTEDDSLGYSVKVHWLWHAENEKERISLGKLEDKMDNMRGGTLYEEYGPKVQKEILNIITSRIK